MFQSGVKSVGKQFQFQTFKPVFFHDLLRSIKQSGIQIIDSVTSNDQN